MEKNFLKKVYGGSNGDEKRIQPRQYSPLVLAYIGDAIFEVFSRTKVVLQTQGPVNQLHNRSKGYVKASAQAQMIRDLDSYLSEEEKGIIRRGRNAKSHTIPKNADLMDYKNATGLEALVGYLYLDGQLDRLEELIQLGFQALEQREKDTE
ncbi:MAG: ribonuclease III [Epulopiscium sp.]|nr:ribonuclease III [Candidatus Epulonipiscium sp.]